MTLLAQVEAPAGLLRDVGNFGWAAVLLALWFMSRSMVTKEDLLNATTTMREEMRKWAEQRFQTKELCAANHRHGNGAPDSD